MTALSTVDSYAFKPSALKRAAKRSLSARAESNLDSDSREMLSILGRTLFFLGLGTIVVITITGDLPMFFVPLGLFLLLGSAMQWKQAQTADAATRGQRRELAYASKRAQDDPSTRCTNTA